MQSKLKNYLMIWCHVKLLVSTESNIKYNNVSSIKSMTPSKSNTVSISKYKTQTKKSPSTKSTIYKMMIKTFKWITTPNLFKIKSHNQASPKWLSSIIEIQQISLIKLYFILLSFYCILFILMMFNDLNDFYCFSIYFDCFYSL